ncbi:MAG: hypothetical protein NZM00_02695, partial [Anaerolinea sp.]|nr:hypothetical protein [Anaerolinea sp.]
SFGYTVISDEDGGARFNPEINDYLINSAGTYSLVLTSANGESGTVRLTLERSELASLDDGPQTVTFDSVVTMRSVAFTAEQGVEYTLTFEVLDGSASPSFDVRVGEFGYNYFSASNVTGGSVSFVAEASGSSVITISEYSYRNSRIVVSLTANE